MFTRHRSQDGKVQYIAEMHDNHLTNTIRAYLRAMEVERQKLANFREKGRPRGDPEARETAQGLEKMARRLVFYLAEAYLRELDDPRFLLRHQLGRSSRMHEQPWPILELVAYYDYEDPYSDFDDGEFGWDPIVELDLD